MCWDSGQRLAFLVPGSEGADVVTCRWDGTEARVLASSPSALLRARSPDGRLLVVGDGLLVPTGIGSPADLVALLGLEPGTGVTHATLSAEPVRILALDRAGRAVLATAEGPRVVAGGPFRDVAISDRGDRVMLLGEGFVEVRAADDQVPLLSCEGDLAAFSGCGRRLVVASGSQLRRIDVSSGASSTLVLPWAPDSLALGQWGQRVLVGHGGEVLSVTWVGDRLRPVAHGAEGWRASPEAEAIVWEAGGQVRVAAFGLAAPPELTVPEFARPRGVRSFPELLRELVPLAHAIAGNGSENPVADGVASEWRLAEIPGTPFRVGVPPGWSVSSDESSLTMSGPEGSILLVGMQGPDASPRELVAAAGLASEIRPGLLAGMESCHALDLGARRQVAAVAWAGGVLMVDLTWPDERSPVLDQLLESVIAVGR